MSRDALVVGINTYQHLPNLTAPGNDAESIAKCFERFGECRVFRLPEVIQEQKPVIGQRTAVTTKMLEDALIRLFKPSGKNVPQTAVFYFSGHGLQRNAGIREGYLATSDTNPQTGNYGLSLYWFRRLLEESPVRQRVVILDCCNSGEFLNYLEADAGAREGTDRLFMAASREYEEAYEALEGTHSVFTKALLSGLNPHIVSGGTVNSHRLTDVVNERLKGEPQQPLFESSGSEIILTRAAGGGPSAHHAQIETFDQLKQLRYNFCPFPGLEPFTESYADLFFGRQDLTTMLTQQVKACQFCAVLGPAGIGKTSLLRAGLIPRLQRLNQLSTDYEFDVRYLTLDQTPLKRLAEVFIDPDAQGLERAEQLRRAESFLHQGASGLAQLVEGITGCSIRASESPRQVVLVIDQLEELFPPLPSPELVKARKLVLDCLSDHTALRSVPLKIVLGIRSDGLEHLQGFPTLSDLVYRQGLLVPPMTYEQIKACMIGPLEQVGLKYDANLIYTLLLDVVGTPGELVLLQFVLKELWQHRELDPTGQHIPVLTLETYTELGGLRQLLRQRATQVYEGLSSPEQGAARRIFLSLCDLEDGTANTRRRVNLQELLLPSLPESLIRTTLNKLIQARLIVAYGDSTGLAEPVGDDDPLFVPAWCMADSGQITQESAIATLLDKHFPTPTVSPITAIEPSFEIVHESLTRSWPLLQQWLAENRSTMRVQRWIEQAAQEWQRRGGPCHSEYLLAGQRLAEALHFQHHNQAWLSNLALTYLSTSHNLAQRSKRNHYAMKLLIPISMAAGMITAYGFDRVSQQMAAQPRPVETNARLAELDRSAAPLFPLPAAQSQTSQSHPAVITSSLIPAGGLTTVFRNWPYHLTSADGTNQAHRAMPLLTTVALETDPYQTFFDSVEAITHSSHLPAQMLTSPGLASAGSQSLPLLSIPDSSVLADTGMTLVGQWAAPLDPSITVQMWCVQTQGEPRCFAAFAP